MAPSGVHVSFWERSIFSLKYLKWIWDLSWDLEFKPFESTQLRATRVPFLPLFSRNINNQLSSNFHRFVISCICQDTPSEKTGLWQLPKASSTFNIDQHTRHLLIFSYLTPSTSWFQQNLGTLFSLPDLIIPF